MNLVQQVVQSLLAQPLRTSLSTLGVVVGVGAVIAMFAVADGARQEVLAQIEQLGTNNLILRSLKARHENGDFLCGLVQEDGVRLGRLMPQVEAQVPLKVCHSKLQAVTCTQDVEILATTREYGCLKGLSMSYGRFLSDRDVSRRELVCVLGNTVAQQRPVAERISPLSISGLSFAVIGILKPRTWVNGEITALNDRDPNQSIFIPLGTECLLTTEFDAYDRGVSEIILHCKTLGNIPTTIALIDRILQLSLVPKDSYSVIVPTELQAQAMSAQRTFNRVLALLAAISLIVGGIGITNIMLATIAERIQEIGIRRSVGATQRQIARHFLAEAMLITGLGGVAGVGLGLASARIIAFSVGWYIQSRWLAAAIAVLMAVVVGVLSGLYPAIRASRIEPMAALRRDV